MSEVRLEFPIVTEQGFPHGLRCTGCQRELSPGQPFAELPMGFDDNYETVLLVCVYCTTDDIDWEKVREFWE